MSVLLSLLLTLRRYRPAGNPDASLERQASADHVQEGHQRLDGLPPWISLQINSLRDRARPPERGAARLACGLSLGSRYIVGE
jgi:hypothetical protein